MSEYSDQKKVARTLRRGGVFFSAVPNELARGAPRWGKVGLLRGLPDILIFDPPPTLTPGIIGTALEMKSRSGRTSPEQRRVLTELAQRGWFAFVGYGADHAIKVLLELGYPITA